jgi:flagellar hook-basal body complex protein FliE
LAALAHQPTAEIVVASTRGRGEGFSGVLIKCASTVNQLSGGAEQQIGSLLKGGSADMSTVMIAVEKADVAFS